MNCKKAERFLLLSFDRPLSNKEKENLNSHLESCFLCAKKRTEYNHILEALKNFKFSEPKPYFWERLRPELREKRKFEPLPIWKRWSLRAVPISLLLVAVFATIIIFFIPQQKTELSLSGALLLQNQNPLQETQPILEEEGIENKNMILIFTTMEEKNNSRR